MRASFLPRLCLRIANSWLQLEESKAKAAEAEATATKQRMLNIEKIKIRDIVRTAFAPLLAKTEA